MNSPYPFSICRIAAYPQSILDQFNSEKLSDNLSKLYLAKDEISKLKISLVDDLYKYINIPNHSKNNRNKLISLKRNVFNCRVINDIDNYLHDLDLLERVNCFFDKCKIVNSIYEQIEKDYILSILESKAILLRFADDIKLKNGILFSSASLFDPLRKIVTSNDSDLLYKEKYTSKFISVLNYLTRSTTKTSPLSSFNTLVLVKLSDSCKFKGLNTAIKVSNLKSAIKVNNLLFLKLKNWMLDSKDHWGRLQLNLNTTLMINNEGIRFFRHHQNNEDFCYLPLNNARLLDIFKFVEDERPTFNDFVQYLDVHVGYSSSAHEFAHRLIDSGIILINFPIIPQENWLMSFIEYLKGIDGNHLHLIKSLNSILTTSKLLESITDVDIRNTLMENVMKDLKHTECDISDLDKSNIFYEDVYDANIHTMNITEHKKSFESIKSLSNIITKLSFKSVCKSLLYTSIVRDIGFNRIPLLEYYHNVYIKEIIYNQSVTMYNQEYSNFFKPFFIKVIQGDKIFLEDFAERTFSSTPSDSVSFDLFMQQNIDSKIVVNNLFHVSGLSITRFYYLFPELNELLDGFKESLNKSTLIAQLRDSSLHNTQINPDIFDIVIDVSQAATAKNSIPLNKLYLRCTEKGNVQLEDEGGRSIIPMDFSMESQNRRSSLFRFINLFCDDNSEGLNSFRELYYNFVKSNIDSDEVVIYLPRIYLSKDVIIERETWYLPFGVLKKIFTQVNSEAKAYVWFDTWRIDHNISDHGFISYILIDKHKKSKPRYINFRSPIYFKQFFQDVLLKDMREIEFKELLPQFPKKDTNEFVSGFSKEIIINFK